MNKKGGSEVFWATFIGELVSIMCSVDDPHGSGKTHLAVRGYFLDSDEEYYYLGEGPLQVDVALKKSLVTLIEISKEKDETLAVLENLPIPDKEEEKN